MSMSSRLMSVTGVRSPTILASFGGRHGSVQENLVGVEGNRRRRQRRLVSMPDQRQVEGIRVVNIGRGGPPAPPNSLDLSIVNLSETVTIHDDEPEVFYDTVSNEIGDLEPVPPIDPEARAMLDSELAQSSGLNTTIDLTESPSRPSNKLITPSSTPTHPSSNNNQSPSSCAYLKCPVCMETFSSIRKRGSRLVSTLCGHVFCGKCLPACVRTSGHCPTCRNSIGYEDFHPLYLF